MNTAEKYDGSFEKLYGQLITLINYRSIISDMSTAYNPEKVVEELEEMEEKAIKVKNVTVSAYACGMMHKAIDIVRRGGVE